MATLTALRTEPRRLPLPLRLLAAPVTAAVVLVGVWFAGGVVTNDFAVAMWLTAGWMAVAGVAALATAVRSRAFRWPVLVGYGATAATLAALLGGSVFMDNVVDERIARAGGGNTVLGAGSFEPVRHAAGGEARVLELADGSRVLTLTRFEVDNGPDLRVYLVAGAAAEEGAVDDFVDLGGLKGNRGNQQYAIPRGVDLDRYSTVVIWCRAFSVLFTRAPIERS
jgi:hypothetical protein